MDKLKAQVLNTDTFAKYGTFAHVLSPQTEALPGDNIDHTRSWPGAGGTVSLGPLASNEVSIDLYEANHRPLAIDRVESHDYTEEGILPLDGDIVILVGVPTANGDPSKKFELFHITRGTTVVLERGVWHWAFTPKTNRPVMVLILLPPRTCKNDRTVVFLEPGIQFEI